MLDSLKSFTDKHKMVLQNLLRISLLGGLMLLSMHAFADDGGVDLLAGTDKDLIKTVTGTGKTFLYIAEIVIAGVAFIKTRNPLVFAGILALSIGFNVVLKIAGITG